MKASFDARVGPHQFVHSQLTIAVKYVPISSNFKGNKPRALTLKKVSKTPSPILVEKCACTMSQLYTNPVILSGVYAKNKES